MEITSDSLPTNAIKMWGTMVKLGEIKNKKADIYVFGDTTTEHMWIDSGKEYYTSETYNQRKNTMKKIKMNPSYILKSVGTRKFATEAAAHGMDAKEYEAYLKKMKKEKDNKTKTSKMDYNKSQTFE